MCLQVTYRCPLCETPSFTEWPYTCDENEARGMDPTDECVRLVKLNRWITNKQHLNWFCSKDTCDYSRVSQAVGGLEIDDIIDAQEEGYQKPPVPEVRANQIAMMPLEDESESAVAAVNGSSGTATANGPAAAIAEMDQSQTDNTSPTPTVGTTQEKAKKPKPWVDLATLDPHTQRKIRELRHEIRRHGPKRRGGLTWWAKCETQLLGICANLKFPHDQILSYIPRHGLSQLRMRLAHLRSVSKGQLPRTLEPRTVKVPVSVGESQSTSTASKASIRK